MGQDQNHSVPSRSPQPVGEVSQCLLRTPQSTMRTSFAPERDSGHPGKDSLGCLAASDISAPWDSVLRSRPWLLVAWRGDGLQDLS